MSGVATEYLPRPGAFDPLEGEGAITVEPKPDGIDKGRRESRTFIRVYKPSELLAYVPPSNQNILGDYHLQRGAISVLAGPPGCGKSRAVLWLGVLGAMGKGNWFGHEVHCQFRTLIIQNENGLSRLHRDIAKIGAVGKIDDWILVSAPPVSGLALQNRQFRDELKAIVREFKPNLVVFDPWNACVRDAMEKDFQEALSMVREVLAEAPDEPACLVLHHLRKPKSDDRHKGRNLAHLLSGSYVLVSVARSVLVMQPASDDTEDDRVVVTCAKNNDGDLGPRSAWRRSETTTFTPVAEFDWSSYDGDRVKSEPKVNEQHLREVFAGGRRLIRSRAATSLMEAAGIGRSAAYAALSSNGGRFCHLLDIDEDDRLGLRSDSLSSMNTAEKLSSRSDGMEL